MVIAGNGSISGITTGGLSANCVDSNAINAGAVTQPKIGSTMYAGYGPAFNAYQSSGHNVTNTTWTKIQLQTENFDTANCFDNTTNYRFTPNVAGYYQITVSCVFAATSSVPMAVSIYKNGTQATLSSAYSGTASSITINGASLMYMNGTTDYIEVYAYQGSAGSLNVGSDSTLRPFSAVLVRSA